MKFSKIVLDLLLILAITAACFACAPAGEDNPPDETPGGETPGGETPGGETPGGETPGGETPGGETPGDEEPEPTGEFSIVAQRTIAQLQEYQASVAVTVQNFKAAAAAMQSAKPESEEE